MIIGIAYVNLRCVAVKFIIFLIKKILNIFR